MSGDRDPVVPLPADDPVAAALAALPPAPPPPPVAGVWARLDGVPSAGAAAGALGRLLRWRSGALPAAAAVLLVALGVFVATRAAPPPAPAAVRVAPVGGPVRLLRGSAGIPHAVSFAQARAGDRLVATAPATVRLGDRVTATLGTGAVVGLASEGEVWIDAGAAGFEVASAGPNGAGGAPLRVLVDDRVVTDRGTRFVVARVPDADAPWDATLSVAVEEGEVDVDGVRVRAGEGFAAPSHGPLTRPGAGVEARVGWGAAAPLVPPAVSLQVEGDAPRAGEAVLLRLFLVNRTPFPVRRPAYDDAAAPLLLESTDPEGTVRTIRVTRDAIVAGGDGDPWLPPTTSPPPDRDAPATLMTARFTSLFPVPGTYRLRALHGPLAGVSDAGLGPALPPLTVEVR